MVAELYDLSMKKNVAKAGRLLHSLVPRAHCFCFYAMGRECGWSSDGAEDYEVDSFIANLPGEVIAQLGAGEDVLRRTLNSGRTVLVLPVHGEKGERIGMLVALFSKNAGKSSSFNPNVLRTILEPAIEVIGESLFIGQKLDAALREVDEIDKELRFVYKVRYQASYADLGSEHELCHVFLGRIGNDVQPNAEEISAIRFVSAESLDGELSASPDRFTPWFKLEWDALKTDHSAILDAYSSARNAP